MIRLLIAIGDALAMMCVVAGLVGTMVGLVFLSLIHPGYFLWLIVAFVFVSMVVYFYRTYDL